MAIRSARGPAAIVLFLAAISACNGAAIGSGSPTATATPTAAREPSSAAATSTTTGPLEDLVPDEVGGVALTKTRVAGPDLGELDPAEAASLAAILENVDGPLEAFLAVNAIGDGINIAAMRMEGTDGRQLGEGFIGEVMGGLEGTGQVEDVTIGGKEVKRITAPDTDPIHVYVTGEVMFAVQAADPALVEDAFAALP